MITSDQLAGFPSEFEYSRESLRRLLWTHSIQGPNDFHTARAAVRVTAQRAITAWKRTAVEQAVAPTTLLRNLIALSPEDDVPVYRVLIDAQDVANWAEDVRKALPPIRKQIGPVPDEWRLLHVLLHSERAPRVLEIERSVLLNPRAALHASFTIAADPVTTGSRLASFIARRWWRSNLPSLPICDVEAVAKVVSLPRLGARDLNRLPVPLRTELLASDVTRRLLLDPGYEEHLRKNPLAHRRTAEAIARRIERHAAQVRTSLARRQMTPAVLAWIRSRGIPASERDRVLWDGLNHPSSRPAPQPGRLAAGAREESLDIGLRSAFHFLSRPARKRLDTIHHKYSWKRLAWQLAAADWVDALVATDSDSSRSVAIRVLAKADRVDVLALLGDRAVAGEARARSAFYSWVGELTTAKAANAVMDPRLARLLAASSLHWYPLGLAPYLEALRSQCNPREIAGVLSRYLTPKNVAEWAPDAQRVFREALAGFAERSETKALRGLLQAIVSTDKGGALLQRLVGSPPESEGARRGLLVELVRMQRRLSGTEAQCVPLQSVVLNWKTVWTAELRRLRLGGVSVPASLARFISSGGEEAIRAALSAYPEDFARLAIRKMAFRDVLRMAFTDPGIAGALERSVPRARLRSQIRWVSDEWGSQPVLATVYEVALAFTLRDTAFLMEMAQRAGPPSAGEVQGARFDSMYKAYTLPKRSGGTRLITAPSKSLKRLQRRLLDQGFAEVPLHRAATGFLPGGSTAENARRHVRQPMVVNADIESFFPKTAYPHIVRACRKLADGKLSDRAVLFVADLCSYAGALPTGAPTSPAIGNIVLIATDRAIDQAAGRFGIEYTRYADDLTFSGHGECQRILPFVEKVLGGIGYEIKRKKVNIFRKGRRQMVTGLVVNDKPNLPRRTRRRLRAAVHHRTNGEQPHWHGRPISDQELFGRLAVLNPVQPEEALRLRTALKIARRPTADSGAQDE